MQKGERQEGRVESREEEEGEHEKWPGRVGSRKTRAGQRGKREGAAEGGCSCMPAEFGEAA